MVGRRIHRVDQRRAGNAPVPGSPPTPRARGPRLLRPARARGSCRASGSGAALRRERLLLLPLLVRGASPARAAVRRGPPIRRAGLPVLSSAGPTRTGRAHGTARLAEVLVRQTYSPDDDLAHIRWLAEQRSRTAATSGSTESRCYSCTARTISRIRCATAERWRAEAERLGLGEIYLCSMQTGPAARIDPATLGFDAAVQFAPFYNLVRRRGRSLPPAWRPTSICRSSRSRHAIGCTTIRKWSRIIWPFPSPPYTLYPCVTPGFDNSPRRPDEGATILTGSTPELYESWLREVVRRLRLTLERREARLRQRVERMGRG